MKICSDDIKQAREYLESAEDMPEKVRIISLGIIANYQKMHEALSKLKQRQSNLLTTLRRTMGIEPSKESPPSEQHGGVGEAVTQLPKKWNWWQRKDAKKA